MQGVNVHIVLLGSELSRAIHLGGQGTGEYKPAVNKRTNLTVKPITDLAAWVNKNATASVVRRNVGIWRERQDNLSARQARFFTMKKNLLQTMKKTQTYTLKFLFPVLLLLGRIIKIVW